MTPNTQVASWEWDFDKCFGVEYLGTHQVMRKGDPLAIKAFIREIASKERAEGEKRGREEAIEFIRANGEWVKEDVHDGNYGYFRADEKLLSEATLPADSTEK